MEKILNKKNIYIISPHFDDAVLSCGGLILKLHKKANITIVNIFTKAHGGPYTLSARKFVKGSGFNNARELFAARAIEDKSAFSGLNIKVINLGLVDVLFRKKNNSLIGKIIPELSHVYPTYRWHAIKKVSSIDTAGKTLRNKLRKVVKKNSIVVAPFGIGNHVDHLLTRSVCEDMFSDIVLYSDFPYNTRTGKYGSAGKIYTKWQLEFNFDKKLKLIKKYESQFAGLFSGSVPKHKEYYFFKKGQK